MTPLFLRDSVEEVPALTVSLNIIALHRRVVEKPIACIQDFFQHPALRSVISSATMESIRLFLPSMVLARCVTNRLVSLG